MGCEGSNEGADDLMFWIITKPNCPHCDRAKDVLTKSGKVYQAFSYDTHPMLAKVMGVAGMKTVPQIWHDKTYIGGADDLEKYLSYTSSSVTIVAGSAEAS